MFTIENTPTWCSDITLSVTKMLTLLLLLKIKVIEPFLYHNEV